jgi:large subunit ribosomal protein L6
MSRIGKQPIAVPKGVAITIGDDSTVRITGPKGELTQAIAPSISLALDGDVLTVTRGSDAAPERALHGLTRALVANMVHGVSEGFERRLEMQGVGYRAALEGKNLRLRIGYSHDVVVEPREGIELAVETNTNIIVRGTDKQKVGQTAAEIRMIRKVEPYKGKGIRYAGEQVRRKAGKSAKVGG